MGQIWGIRGTCGALGADMGHEEQLWGTWGLLWGWQWGIGGGYGALGADMGHEGHLWGTWGLLWG